MKELVRRITVFGLSLLPFTPAISANDVSGSECYQTIMAHRDFTLDMPSYTQGNAVVDSAILTAASVASVPTLAATLPVGVVLVVAHGIGASAVKEAKVAGHSRLLGLLKEAALFTENDTQSLDGFPVLKELWYRVNGPFFKKITPQQVANSVLKAKYDIDFCSDAENFRLVHFKDYVLEDVNG